MSNLKYLAGEVNLNFFEMPQNKFKSKVDCLKYNFTKNFIDAQNPSLYVCNRVSKIDKLFLPSIFKNQIFILKDEIVRKIWFNTLPAEEKDDLFKSLKVLKEYFISVVVFPEISTSVFGNCQKLPNTITTFLYKTEFDLKFLYFTGTFFSSPIWLDAKSTRRVNTGFKQQFSLTQSQMKKMNLEKINEEINKLMPSSASVYAQKFNIEIRSEKRAESLETIAYCCPNCASLFTLFSEFNCLKCKNCGTATEIEPDGSFHYSKYARNLDDLSKFQLKVLSKVDLKNKPIVTFEDVRTCILSRDEFFDTANVKLDIYGKKVVINYPNKTNEIKFSSVKYIELLQHNILSLTLKNDQNIYLRGSKSDPIYIICDLWQLSLHSKS